MDKVGQVKALENGNGIQYLLNSAYRIFGNPIYVIDINHNLLAFTDVQIDDPFWNEVVTTGTFSSETVEILANEGLIEYITNAENIAVMRSDKLKYAKMAGHIFNRDNISVGLVMMTESNIPFNPESIAAFKALEDKITAEIKNYDYFTVLAMTYHEDKINLLLDGAVKNPLLYNTQAQMLYNGFEDYLYVAVVSVARRNMLEVVHRNRLEYFKSMLKTKYKSFKYSVYSDYIVVLMSSKQKNFYGAPFFITHATLFEQNGLFMGVSGSFENIYELRGYYDQAVAALANGLKGKVSQRVFLHNSAY